MRIVKRLETGDLREEFGKKRQGAEAALPPARRKVGA